MLQELTIGGPSRRAPLNRILTPIVKYGARQMLRWRPAGSVLTELPTGQQLRFGNAGTDVEPHLKLNNYNVLSKSLRRGSIGFAEAYIDGDIDCSDLVGLFRFFLQNRSRLEDASHGLFKARMLDRIAHQVRRNSRRGSRRNIVEHYDLGNDFYRAWLDPEMVYSSGFYGDGARSLEEAQRAKFDLVLEFLDPKHGEEILEIGSGWGALARHIATNANANVTGITLSDEQLALSRAAAADEALDGKCRFHLQDYRDVQGQFDHIVSIEMIEAVGVENWPRYFSVLHDRLKPGGTAVLQAITIDEKRFDAYRRKADFIQRFVFPAACCPRFPLFANREKRRGWSWIAISSSAPAMRRPCASGANASRHSGPTLPVLVLTSVSAGGGSTTWPIVRRGSWKTSLMSACTGCAALPSVAV
jgi:cyclopropane-fatty-acyl-phospholipid synthase